MKKNHSIKRFGIVAMCKGYISLDNLMEALKIQIMDDLTRNEHKDIGTILHSQGYITEKQIDDVLNALKEQINRGKELLWIENKERIILNDMLQKSLNSIPERNYIIEKFGKPYIKVLKDFIEKLGG